MAGADGVSWSGWDVQADRAVRQAVTQVRHPFWQALLQTVGGTHLPCVLCITVCTVACLADAKVLAQALKCWGGQMKESASNTAPGAVAVALQPCHIGVGAVTIHLMMACSH